MEGERDDVRYANESSPGHLSSTSNGNAYPSIILSEHIAFQDERGRTFSEIIYRADRSQRRGRELKTGVRGIGGDGDRTLRSDRTSSLNHPPKHPAQTRIYHPTPTINQSLFTSSRRKEGGRTSFSLGGIPNRITNSLKNQPHLHTPLPLPTAFFFSLALAPGSGSILSVAGDPPNMNTHPMPIRIKKPMWIQKPRETRGGFAREEFEEGC